MRRRSTMSTTTTLATTVHDVIDEVTTAAEEIHKSVADLPLEVLGAVTPLQPVLDELKTVQTRSIGAVYGLVRTVNRQVRDLITGPPPPAAEERTERRTGPGARRTPERRL
jgi:hypothetical protein